MSTPRPLSEVGIIVAMSPERVIGRNNRIPWRRRADQQRFKRLTLGSTVIMGRRTFESIGRPLPKRLNVVVSRGSPIPDVRTVASLDEALQQGNGPYWIAGGVRLYEEALRRVADFVDLTYVSERVPIEGSVRFPELDPEDWLAGRLEPNPEDPSLCHQRFFRIGRRPG